MQEKDKCDEILLFMPHLFGVGNHGHGSQLNNYILAAMVATYLNKAMVILEAPADVYDVEGGSQFGCPMDAFEKSETLANSRVPGTSNNISGIVNIYDLIMKTVTDGISSPSCTFNRAIPIVSIFTFLDIKNIKISQSK